MNLSHTIAHCLVVLTLSTVGTAFGGVNLFTNPEFASEDGRLPSGWAGLGGKENERTYHTANGVLTIRGETAAYAKYVSQTVTIRDDRSYYFEAEVESDALSGPAAVVYSVCNGAKRKIVADRPILSHFTGPQKGWAKFGGTIPIPVGEDARTLSIGFILYNPSRHPGAAYEIRFRKPVLCEYEGQTVPRLAESKTGGSAATMPDNPFPDNFTGEPIGSIYRLERGGVGFLRMNSGSMPGVPATLKVEAPAGVETELYLSKRGSGNLTRIPSDAAGVFAIPAGYAWITWGNALLFRANESAPERFALKLTLTAMDKTVSYEVPVRIEGAYEPVALPENRRFNSWQAFPATRIDVTNPENRLGIALSDYWKASGWRHTPFVEIVNAVPWRLPPTVKGAMGKCRVAKDANGAPLRSWCDQAQIALGPDYFRELLLEGGLSNRLSQAEFAMWDYEPYCEGALTAGCFCEDCRATFARESGLSAVPMAREILAQHLAKWIPFRCRQRAQVVAAVVKALKSVNPAIRFQFCSMPGDPGTDPDWFRKYGIDLSLYNGFVDVFATMNYSGSLDFFRSLENEKKVLARESRMFVSNGWGSESNAKRTALRLVAAFFAGVDYPFIGQGLYVSQCDQIAAFRKAMAFIARTEKKWSAAAYNPEKLPLANGFRGEGNVYSLERKAADGTRYVIVFNNSDRDTAYAKLTVPGEGVLTVALAPLSLRFFDLSASGREERARRSAEDAERERQAIAENAKLFEKRTAHGMTTDATPDAFKVLTPAQALSFDLRDSGTAAWWTGGKSRGTAIGRDYLALGEMFTAQDNVQAAVERSEIGADAVRLTIAYHIVKAPYDGLTVRRHYRIFRETPGFDVDLEVVPDGGWRPFRLRTGVNFALTPAAAPTDVISEYEVDGRRSAGTKHVAFAHPQAKFPGGKPFFAGRYAKTVESLASSACRLKSLTDGVTFEISTPDRLDQIFGWREPKSASVELIYPNAYETNDPHAVKTWRTCYTVRQKNEMQKGGSQE